MDRDTLLRAIDEGPVRVFMNDGKSYEIPDHKSCMIDQTICYVLQRGDDGRYRAIWLSLVCMVRVERISVPA